MKKYYEINECDCLSEIVHFHFGGNEEVKKFMLNQERYEYSKKIGVELYKDIIDFDDIFEGWRNIPMNDEKEAPVELKNQFHRIVSLFGMEGAELISKKGMFGRAYYNALLNASRGKHNCCLPTAKMIFAELKKLLTRASYHGFIIDESVKKYI